MMAMNKFCRGYNSLCPRYSDARNKCVTNCSPYNRRTLIILLCCLLLCISACSTSPTTPTTTHTASSPTAIVQRPTPTPTANKPTPMMTSTPMTDTEIAARMVKGMSLDEKLGQMVVVEFYGSTVTPDVLQMVQANHISGVLIENKNGNAQTSGQLVALTKGIQASARIPLFVTTDYEGGVVNELRQITGERPSNADIGATNNLQAAYNAGYGAATDLTGLGLNVNFMPIVDILTNPNNPGLPRRSFGNNPTLVTNMGRAYLKGLSDGHIVGCLKHFPGLGSANLDPHLSLPYMNRSLATLNAVDLVPYRVMISEGIVPMVMVTHILNPQLDPKLPTSLSPNVVTGMLRNNLNFKGVIISDTLWMGGISNTYTLAQAAVLAVKAGTDLLLGPRGLAETQTMIFGLKQAVLNGMLTQSQIDASVTRILALKLQYNILSHDRALQMAGVLGDSESRGSMEHVQSGGLVEGDVRRGVA